MSPAFCQQVETRQTGVERELPGGEVEHLGTTVSRLRGWLCQQAKACGLNAGGGEVGRLFPHSEGGCGAAACMAVWAVLILRRPSWHAPSAQPPHSLLSLPCPTPKSCHRRSAS